MFEAAISPKLRDLIDLLVTYQEIKNNFYLAGGTGLALLIGHRQSLDLDMFSERNIDIQTCLEIISDLKGQIISQEKGTVHAECRNVRLSFLHYPYPLLAEQKTYRGIRIASIEDIACMKAVAVSQRGEKKDFFDLYVLIQKLGPERLKELLVRKYGPQLINLYHILKSFLFFEDAEAEPEPKVLTDITWPEVKDYFLRNEKQFKEVFLG